MYSVHSYYLAVITSSIVTMWIYPCFLTLFSFYCFEFEYSSLGDMLTYMMALIILANCGGFFGICVGTFTNNEMLALLVAQMIIMLMNFGSGVIANTGDNMNPVIQLLTWISPMHYAVQILFQ